MSNPKFSIIIPTYNRVNLLQRAIESVFTQEYINWELIVIDDGSTDETRDYVENIKSEKIVYKYQKNKGRSAARNIGIEISTGSYICFLDSDDELLNNYLVTFHRMIEEHRNEIYLTGVRLQSEDNYEQIVPIFENNEYITQCLEGAFNLMPFCFHRSKISNSSFQSNLYYGEDFQFIIPTILNSKVNIRKQDNCIVHQHSNRTIKKIFIDVEEAYSQFDSSILRTIDSHSILIDKKIGKNKCQEIRDRKIRDFILTAAKYDLGKSISINELHKETKIGLVKLTIQRAKGILQGWIA